MKHLIYLSVLLFVFQIAFTQDYQCIKDDATYFFTDGTNIKAIQIDSVVMEGDDQVFYNFPSMTDDPVGDCYITFGPSWIGRKVKVNPNGDHSFYNKSNQNILIKTTTGVGVNWLCYSFPNGNYIHATIADIYQMEFLELTDSVKKITFQAYNSAGGAITHSINDKYILISKTNGLVRTINFKLFPDLVGGIIYDELCKEYSLSGITDPQVGIQNLTAARVYDFDTDDEIHRNITLQLYGWNKESNIKNIYLDKQYSNDTVSYLLNSCGWSLEYNPDTMFTSHYNDTIIRNYFIGIDSLIEIIPEKVIVDKSDPYYWQYYVTNFDYFGQTGRMRKTIMGGFFSDYPHDCIFVFDSDNNLELGNDKKYYIEGLGVFRYFFDQYSLSEYNLLHYYKKGTEEWGTPYTFNCEDFITSTNQNEISIHVITIAPNPMKNWTLISIESEIESEYSFLLFNSMGIQVKEFNFFGTAYKITRDGLPAGIYFYFLDNSKGFKTSGKLILQ